MNNRSKQIVFTILSVLLIGVSDCFTLNRGRGQAFETPNTQRITSNPTVQSSESPGSQLVIPFNLQPQQVIKWSKQYPTTIVLTVAVILYLAVLGLRPTWLLLLPLDKIPKIGIISEIPIPSAIASFLKYRPRVLDAWVSQRIIQAQETFENRPTVKDRKIHIPVPVELNGNKPAIAKFSVSDLRGVFSKQFTRLLIVGEGGVGKTSLACQIARWAMADKKAERLCKHRMLPVLIEEELEATEGKSPLLEAIARQIKNLRDDEKPVSEELLKQLLEKRRILVIVDHLSEMGEATRKASRLRDPSSPVNVLIVTSRIDDVLGKEVTHTTLKPKRVSGDKLSGFMDTYLNEKGKRDLFSDPEYFDALRRLSQIVTVARDVTVLFAKLYADQMVARAEDLITDDLPDNVPDLMLSYINEVNREKDGKLDDDIVQRDLKVIAWECLKRTFKPETAEREKVIECLAALEGEGNIAKECAKKRLKYLEERLALVRTVPPAKTKLRFALDPLAEYLAGLYITERYGEDEQAWRAFLDEAKDKPSPLEEIRGFLLATRDCCIIKVTTVKIPSFVNEELNKLTGIDPETIEREKLERKIKLLIQDLNTTDDRERVAYAAQRLQAISEFIKANKPELVSLLKDVVTSLIKVLRTEDEQLHSYAELTLTKIGSLAVPALVDLLKDEKTEMRRLAVGIFRQIPLEAKTAVPNLMVVLNSDPDAIVRWNSAIALSKIIMVAKDEIHTPPLVKAFIQAFKEDTETGVRSYSAFALGKLGVDAEGAIPIFLEELSKDRFEDFNLLVAIVEALEAIGTDLDSVEVEVILDGIKKPLRKVVFDHREKLYQEAKMRKQSSQVILSWRPVRDSFTPPQKDLYSTGADVPKWL